MAQVLRIMLRQENGVYLGASCLPIIWFNNELVNATRLEF